MAEYEIMVQDTLSCADDAKAEVFRRIESSPDIPDAIKQAVKDFVAENWVSLISNTITYIPDEISEYFDIIKEMVISVKTFMGL